MCIRDRNIIEESFVKYHLNAQRFEERPALESLIREEFNKSSKAIYCYGGHEFPVLRVVLSISLSHVTWRINLGSKVLAWKFDKEQYQTVIDKLLINVTKHYESNHETWPIYHVLS